jgi:2-isopropylmalate synthase
MHVQRNKAIVGQNAFAHEAGIHQHGMLQERSTYEIMRPEDVGIPGTNLVLGKHSGRHAFRDRTRSMGYTLDDATLDRVFNDFIALADKKKEVYDADIAALIENRIGEQSDLWQLVKFQVFGGTGTISTSTVELRFGDDLRPSDAATGDGPVDALFRALERVTGIAAQLQDYQVRSVSGGKDAQGEVLVELRHGNRAVHGKGISTDILEASALAYLKALNKIAAGRVTQTPKGV